MHVASVVMAGLSRAACAVVLALAGSAALAQAQAAPGTYPQAHWARPEPAESGWSADRLRVADESARSIGSDAYLVVRRGVIVHAFGPVDKPMNLASMRKSVLGVLIGIEVDRGRIDLDQTVGDLGLTDKGGLSESERSATLRQLLQSRSGIYHPAAYETAAMKAGRPYRGSHPPGTFWYYNNWDFNALGTAYQQLSGRSVFAGLASELAGPLQFEDFVAGRDTESVSEMSSEHPAYVMRLSARDVGRIGVLMARGGRWQERQIVSGRWVDDSTRSYSEAWPGMGYGYLWWVGLGHRHFGQKFAGAVFSAQGNFGQFLLVDPARDWVVVHRVDMRLFAREVSAARFGELLERIVQAAPAGF